ncbi:MAG: glucosaminidase domain-containing protein [Acidimicrobiia bacterium]
MPRCSRRFVALALGLASLLAAAPSASAQADPFDQEIARAQAEVEAAQAAAHEAAGRLVAAQEQLAAVEAEIVAVQAHVAEIEAQIPALKAEVKRLRRIVRHRAAALYRNSGPTNKENAIPLNPSLQAVRHQRLTDAAAKQDDATMDQLDAAVAQLAATKQELAAQQGVLAQQQQQLGETEAQLASQQAELDRRVAIANSALERARALGALRANGEPVMGPTILTAAQMAGWWRTRDYTFRVPGMTIDSLAQLFVEEGQAEYIRGDLAFAQSIIETGGFRSAPSNNFAGLGWCDSCSTGRRFPSARDGIRAQVQHLKNYADSTSRSSGLAYPPSPYWYGSNPVTARRNFDTFYAKGWAPTWNDMGKGNWATSRTYSENVLRVYADMIAYAQTHG